MFNFATHIRWPLSGNVAQAIAPAVEIAGIPEIESAVVTDVASYGSQLGDLIDAVVVLATAAGIDTEEIAKVRKLQAEVDATKRRECERIEARVARLERKIAEIRSSD